jgi:hypothetical protein
MEGGIGPPQEEISGSELFGDLSGEGTDIQGIDGDEVSGKCHLVVFGFPHGWVSGFLFYSLGQ